MCLVHLLCQYAGQEVKCESSNKNEVAITHYRHGNDGEGGAKTAIVEGVSFAPNLKHLRQP